MKKKGWGILDKKIRYTTNIFHLMMEKPTAKARNKLNQMKMMSFLIQRTQQGLLLDVWGPFLTSWCRGNLGLPWNETQPAALSNPPFVIYMFANMHLAFTLGILSYMLKILWVCMWQRNLQIGPQGWIMAFYCVQNSCFKCWEVYTTRILIWWDSGELGFCINPEECEIAEGLCVFYMWLILSVS